MLQPVKPGARRWIGIAAWIVATGLLVLLFTTVDTSRVVRVLEHADVRWLIAAVAANLLIQPFGAMQWRALLPSGAVVSRRRMLRLFSLTSVANNTTPSLIGHVTGTVLLAAEPTVGKASALSVLALDQLAVGLVKVAILLAASALLPLPAWMHRGLVGLAIGVGVLLVTAVIVARRTRYLDVLREPSRFAVGAGYAVCVKLAEATAILAVQHAFGLSLPLQSVLLVLAATALGSVVPIAPANIGTYEAAAYGAYRFLGLPAETALGIAVVQHVCQLLPAVGVGYLLLSAPNSIAPIPPLRRDF
jgi:uncharacterized membrane protein YbhN (UPF0104 family)